MDLLWTNTSPTSSFSAQAVNIDLTTYEAIMISFETYSDHTNLCCQIFPKDNNSYKLISIYGAGGEASGNVIFSIRPVTFSTTAVNFGNAQASNVGVENNTAVPYQIYGIK